MTRLVLIGGGGHGAVVADIAARSGCWRELVFLDDRYPEISVVEGLPVVGTFEALSEYINSSTEFVVTIGNNTVRMNMQRRVADTGGALATVIDPSAIISASASVGDGSVVMPGAVINARSIVGQAVIVNTAASVDHDCRLGDAAHISPGAHLAGGVRVGIGSWIGIGAAVIGNIVIGDNAVVGAGAAVISNVVAGTTVAGVPAKPMGTQK